MRRHAVIFGVALYAFFSFVWNPIHYIHLMFITLVCCVLFAVAISKWIFATSPELRLGAPSKVVSQET